MLLWCWRAGARPKFNAWGNRPSTGCQHERLQRERAPGDLRLLKPSLSRTSCNTLAQPAPALIRIDSQRTDHAGAADTLLQAGVAQLPQERVPLTAKWPGARLLM